MNPGRQRGRLPFDDQTIDWEAFEQLLNKNHKVKVSRDLIRYSRPYAHLLQDMNLSELKDIRDTLRPNILKALSALAKYLGVYQEYQKAIRDFGFRWGGKNADQIIIDRLNKVENPGEVFEWIHKAKAARPELTDFLDLMGITGLRLVEAVECYNLIIDLSREEKLGSYYDSKKHILEHFRFKEIFIRKW